MTQLDANQVIKTVYDATVSALSTSPKYVDTVTWLNAVPANTNVNSSAVNILPYKIMGVVADWTGLNATDATLKFQGSLDGSVWDDIGSAYTIATAAGHKSFSLVDEPYKYARIVYTKGTNSTGTVTVKYILRA